MDSGTSRWVNPICTNLVTWQIFQREDATTLLIIESESSVLYLFCGKPPNCQCHLSSSTLSSAFWSHDREIDWFWAKHIEDFVLYYTTNFTDLKDADIGAHGPMGIHSKWKNKQPFKKVNQILFFFSKKRLVLKFILRIYKIFFTCLF